MNTEAWSFAEGYCKIKSARQKKRLTKKDFDKQLLRIYKLKKTLFQQKLSLPLVPLAEPYQRGWKRTFILREDVARSKHADFYRDLLKKVNTVEYSHNKGFTKKKRRKRKRVYEVRPQHLREFYTWEWVDPKCKLTDAEKALFSIKEYWCRQQKTIITKYVFTEPWRFVLQVRPDIVTHKKMVDEVLESAIQQLDNQIERNHLRPVMNRLIYGACYNPWRGVANERERNPLKNKPLYQILEAVANDDL
jgi:hypothetical protein